MGNTNPLLSVQKGWKDYRHRTLRRCCGCNIRANQGHSIQVDVELEEMRPPEVLYHGTGAKYEDSVDAQGLLPKTRLYVHLSGDSDTAKRSNRGTVALLFTGWRAGKWGDGIMFCRSVNGVWLVKVVSVKYLEKIGHEKKKTEQKDDS